MDVMNDNDNFAMPEAGSSSLLKLHFNSNCIRIPLVLCVCVCMCVCSRSSILAVGKVRRSIWAVEAHR
jgi:hypothetical protein